MTALRIDPGAAPLRRQLGPVPWFVLEELVLLAGADSVVETNVRALAAGLSLNKDTVARALGRPGPSAWWRALLSEYGTAGPFRILRGLPTMRRTEPHTEGAGRVDPCSP